MLQSYLAETVHVVLFREKTSCENRLKAMLIYHHGVVHVTCKFYNEIRDLLCEVLGSSLCIKIILLKELKSILFRMFPVIITIAVINTSNLSLDKFQPVQKFLVSSILFQSYSRLFLQRTSPKIDIDTNPFFKTKLQELVSQHKEEFTITHLSKRKTLLPLIQEKMIVITSIMFFVIHLYDT